MLGHMGRELLTVALKKVGWKEGSRWLQFRQSGDPSGQTEHQRPVKLMMKTQEDAVEVALVKTQCRLGALMEV